MLANPSRRAIEFNELVRDINTKTLIRVMEWDTPTGIIRFGIPRRCDGQVRMEIQQRQSFPPPSETLWSIEAVRLSSTTGWIAAA